jgi:EmrB/QacA subfamily drug resistance transporter
MSARHATPETTVLDPRRRWLLIAAMAGSLAMIMIDMTIVAVALPAIGDEFGLGETSLQWVINAYVLVLASTVALGGRLGDILGKRTAFLLGVSIFGLASLLCGLAPTGEWLIVSRVVQAIGAVLMQPASAAIVLSASPPEARGKTMAIYVGVPLLFMSLGPIVGGVITETVGWRWNLYLNVPIAVVIIAMTLWVRPSNARGSERRIDPLATVLLLLSLPLLVGGIQQSAAWGFLDGKTLACVGGGLLGAVFFLWRQRVVATPTLHLELFRDRAFFACAALLFVMQFSMAGGLIQLSLFAQDVLGYEPLEAGLSILPLMIPVLFVVHVAGRAYDRSGVRRSAVIGAVGSALGLAIMGAGIFLETYWVIAVGMVALGGSSAFVTMPANTEALARVGLERRAQASGLMQTARQLGATLGIAVFATLSVATEPSSVGIAMAFWLGTVLVVSGAAVAWAFAPTQPFSRAAPSAATDPST